MPFPKMCYRLVPYRDWIMSVGCYDVDITEGEMQATQVDQDPCSGMFWRTYRDI